MGLYSGPGQCPVGGEANMDLGLIPRKCITLHEARDLIHEALHPVAPNEEYPDGADEPAGCNDWEDSRFDYWEANEILTDALISGQLKPMVRDRMTGKPLSLRPGFWEVCDDQCVPYGQFINEVGDIDRTDDTVYAQLTGKTPFLRRSKFKQWLRAWYNCNHHSYPPVPDQSSQVAPTSKATIASQTKCQAWLVDMMRSGPPSKVKDQYFDEAQEKFSVSHRGFDRAWSNAASEVGNFDWQKPGPRMRS